MMASTIKPAKPAKRVKLAITTQVVRPIKPLKAVSLKPVKRQLFAELVEGMEALAAARKGKITLRQHLVAANPAPLIDAQELIDLRGRLNLSRAVLARYLRTNERTLENWEQGRARPNAQAALLIKLVEHYPDTVDRLALI